MTLLANRFAPITFEVAFVDAPLDRVVKAYIRWQHVTLRTVSKKAVFGSLASKLEWILPLEEGGGRVLFSATASDWTAIFESGIRGTSPLSIMSVLGEWMKVRGLALTEIPHTFKKSAPAGERGVWGALSISEHGIRASGEWGLIRLVSLRTDAGGCKFQQIGSPWEFEEVQRYNAKPVETRLNSDLLASYLRHLGVKLQDEGFFDGTGIATRSRLPLTSARKKFELKDVQRQMRLSSD